MYVSMKDMLLHAHHNNYAVMAINCVNMEQVKAVIESAEEEKSAVIINISPRQMKAHGYGYIMAPLIENLAKRASVPVAFNLDHGANFEDITAAMQYGFSSVMIDSSSYEFEENVRRTQQIAKTPDDYEARATLMWAGSLSHNGLTGTGRQSDFASHKIEHELGGMFDVAHGAGLCAVWGSWARYVYKTNPARFAQFAVRVFDVPENFYDVEATALKGIEAWEDWCHKIGMPINLHELGIDPTDDQIKEMAEKCVATGGGTVGFFQPLNKDDIINIYKMSK